MERRSRLSPRRFRHVLWNELRRAELLSDPALYKASRAEVTRYGTIESRGTISLVGHAAWRRTIARLPRPRSEDDCIRVLGFGRVLTEFAVAPLPLQDGDREAVSHLGALANFIVATFDQLIDAGMNRRVVLPEWTLRFLARTSGRVCLAPVSYLLPAPPRLMVRLVAAYFRTLEELSLAQRHSHGTAMVRRLILKMYRAERQTFEPSRAPGSRVEQIVRRKASLPITALGLPGWLACSGVDRARYLWHLRWLHNLGEFVGWIDDSVDLEQDLTAGRPNRVAMVICARPEASHELARLIAQGGKKIIREWRSHVQDADAIPLVVREALRTCVVSWFGGLSALETGC